MAVGWGAAMPVLYVINVANNVNSRWPTPYWTARTIDPGHPVLTLLTFQPCLTNNL